MRFEQLDDWLRWMECQHPRNIELGLERISAVARRIDIDLSMPVVTVAGTNGKGSCTALLAAIYAAEGYQVGAYTSPHLNKYNERIAIDGRYVDDESLCRAFAAIDSARGDISLTYFEFGTLAALLIFMQRSVDIVVLEVGLGGRLDAVNIIDADVAIISSIAVDHEAWLGADRDVIGREKAGIFRAQKMAVIGDAQPPASIRAYGKEVGASLVFRGGDFNITEAESAWQWRGRSASGATMCYENLPYPAVLIDNAATVLQALQYVGLPISEQAIKQGLSTVSLAGRCQHIEFRGIDVLLDVAHNPASVVILREHLTKFPVEGKTECLFAVMADKDLAEMISTLKPCFSHWNIAPLADNDRAATPDDILAALQVQGVGSSSTASTFKESLDEELSRLSKGDRLVVFGSFFTVAAAVTEIDELLCAEQISVGESEL
ncbi:Dihydrofolate synthase/folylpolyglutamate synthase [Zhongshania aliphaticivorans]|uniref:Dihydrofolate synthase/folylpolyglutamate synthase n=1 Tax=Zhongshania aliphaticivorans TaxID=1470434 RepID=A0A5S9QBW1_9GAMM|nr:bifunctional tetrahydrofolate synthase/dihydrofolate synthase [Zhongshania aliphaticivorans]CAA0087918.1 Dihydrofolate synthase/folylpolyglutamate synthase [Zhongshania aliphaticivorans]CAA0115649.1 Dihydrofolate synthase/folylpolyglutamate synthase [Zhongshania aliphaticivorans]CAA0120269.1 Dihydrofolate synthase/folylpolyglutamate synthase [Zhongshania aliphaticivorans]